MNRPERQSKRARRAAGPVASRLARIAFAVTTVCVAASAQADGAHESRDVPVVSTIGIADGVALALRRWGDDRAATVVLALHGFNDYGSGMERLARHLSGPGITVYAPDQRGFGSNADRGYWPGAGTLIDDAARVALALRERHPDSRFYLVGTSMGGAVAALARIRTATPVDGTILIAPAVWGRGTMPWYQRTALWLGTTLFPGMRFTGRLLDRFIDIHPTDDPEVLARLRTDPLVLKDARADTLDGMTALMDAALAEIGALPGPALILYGGRDDIIPAPAACAMLDRLYIDGAARRMAFYPDGYHMLTRQLGADPVLDDIAAWLDDPAAPLPSGHEVEHAEAVTAICDGVRIG